MFSPSALHHGSVHGCFSASAGRLISAKPSSRQCFPGLSEYGCSLSVIIEIQERKPSDEVKGFLYSEPSSIHITKREILAWSALLLPRKLCSGSAIFVVSLRYANRPAKVRSLWQLRAGLSDGGYRYRSRHKSSPR